MILDACVLLNLLATDRVKSILECQEREILICDLVRSETYFLKAQDGSDDKILINLDTLIGDSTIGTCDLENDTETDLFVNLAAQLDDGEAKSMAICLSRQFAIATDDKKARRLITEAGGASMLHSSLELVRTWSELNRISSLEVRQVLLRIKTMANYFPNRSDANYDWWNSKIS